MFVDCIAGVFNLLKFALSHEEEEEEQTSMFGCFPGMTSSTCKTYSTQIFGCALSDAFTTICSFLTFLNNQMGLIIIKDRRRAVYFNNQTALHLIFNSPQWHEMQA